MEKSIALHRRLSTAELAGFPPEQKPSALAQKAVYQAVAGSRMGHRSQSSGSTSREFQLLTHSSSRLSTASDAPIRIAEPFGRVCGT